MSIKLVAGNVRPLKNKARHLRETVDTNFICISKFSELYVGDVEVL